MTDKLKELKTLLQFSEALGVEADPVVVSEMKVLEAEQKRQNVLESIKSKQTKARVITEIKTDPEPSESVIEHSSEELISKAKELLTSGVIKEEVSLESRIKIIESHLRHYSFGSYGSGEVRFKYLDDVDRDSIGDPSHVLKYNPDSKKFYFGETASSIPKNIQIESATFAEAGASVPAVPGMIAWNSQEDCLDIYQNDGSTCQVGLENYIEVYNGTSNPIPHGTVVRFDGVYGFNGWIKPSIDLFVADSNAIPEYIVGVVTTDLEPGQTGRATTLGKVRELNTTGSTVGEVWQVGDILYAHPSIPGELTRNKPTAPNVAISVAAVLKVSDTIGVLLVRPIIFPRLYYGGWYSSVNQTPGTLNAPHAVTFNNQDPTSGFHIEDGTTIVAENSGLYNFQFSLQVSTNTGSLGNVWIWYRKNGVDVAHSSTQVSIAANGFNVAPAWNFLVSLNAGETFQLYWATNRSNVFLAADPATTFCPSTPSAILTVTQVNQ